MTVTQTRMTMIFNEWNHRYLEDPESFSSTLDEEGNPVEDYGELCMRHFNEIANDLESKGLLPKPSMEKEVSKNPLSKRP